MDEILNTLRQEFEATPGSFLLKLRCELSWDKAAFSRVTAAMHALVMQRNSEEPIPRWIAEGFWYFDSFVKEWSTHDNFPREHDRAYYESAYVRLYDLAYWLFIGESPYIGGSGFDPL